MKLSDYNYDLPENLIAQTPVSPRDNSKLLVIDKKTGNTENKIFKDIIDYLNEGDVLVTNSTKVIPARIFAKKVTGGTLEIFLLKRLSLDTWECLIKPAKKLKLLQEIIVAEGKLRGTLIEIKEDGNRTIKFKYEGVFEKLLDELGNMPLPPYIKENLNEKDRYQTVYAKYGNSVAAPTAGLHFTEELLEKIEKKGIKIVDVFLEVGLGTFRPVKTENVFDHKMHEESFEIPLESKKIIENQKKLGKRIIAVGTTSVRVLESVSSENGVLEKLEGKTDIFIYPSYKFKMVDAMITNFHLPKSTLLMLVSAFYSREKMLEIYIKAVNDKYRFFSFGDAMYIY